MKLSSIDFKLKLSLANKLAFLFIVAAVFLSVGQVQSAKLKPAISSFAQKLNKDLYHTTDTIISNLRTLAKGSCKGKLIERTFKESNTFKHFLTKKAENLTQYQKYLSIFSLSNYSISNKDKLKVFIIAGEHARELISVELAYYFVNIMCSGNPLSKFFLDKIDFRIIPIANPLGRIEVESGNYCKRSNPNHVDPNRNWDTNWVRTPQASKTDEYSGIFPFSEIESSFVKDSVTTFKPDVFLTLHSGVFGLFYPYASKLTEGEYNIDNLKSIMGDLKQKFCNYCSVGTPSEFLGYVSPGNCLDYVYDKLKVPYAMAWEIYTNEINYIPYMNKEKSLKEGSHHHKNSEDKIHHLSSKSESDEVSSNKSASPHSSQKGIEYPESAGYNFKENSQESNYENAQESYNNHMMHNLSFIEVSNTIKSSISKMDSMRFVNTKVDNNNTFCLNLFNPNEERDYTYIIENWSKMMIFTFKDILQMEGK